jgi:hypothetical protein
LVIGGDYGMKQPKVIRTPTEDQVEELIQMLREAREAREAKFNAKLQRESERAVHKARGPVRLASPFAGLKLS